MPSRFVGLPPHITQPARVEYDVYDNVPLEPGYVPPVSLAACARKPAV